MNRMPEAVIVVDPGKEKNCVQEARNVGAKVIALIDTDSDPDVVDLPIPGNDDSIRSIRLILSYLTDSLITGRGLNFPKSRRLPRRTSRGRFPRFRNGPRRAARDPPAKRQSKPGAIPCESNSGADKERATMAEITAAAVKALRDKTDLPMMLVKKALIEAEGDEEKAKEILKREGLKVKEKRADNPTEEGRIFIAVARTAKRP